jgi:glycosyltransferase involved in cell wall biosynthesis
MPASRRRKRGPSDPIRVAQVCGTTDGALWMVQIAVGLKRRGFEVMAIIGGDGGGTASALRKVGIPYVVIPQLLRSNSRMAALVGRLPYLYRLRVVVDGLALLRTSVRMARTLRRHDIDVVHTHVFSSMMIGRAAGAIARVPIRVAMIAGPLHLEAPGLRELDLATYRLDHRLLAGCQHTNDLYAELGVPERRRTTVGYGIDPAGYDPAVAERERVRAELGIADETPLIGQVAFFYPVLRGPVAPPGTQGRGIKGHEDLMAAARLVLDQRPDVRFLVVGDGFGDAGREHFEEIRRLARELEIDHAVIFAGRRRDLADVISALDVSVQASLSENYGGTIESLLMCAPVIATRAGGMPEVVIDGETGLLVPTRDPDALASAMLRLVDDRELAIRLGRAGRERMLERHTIQRTIDGVVEVYREIARQRGLRRPPLNGTTPPPPREERDAPIGLMPRDVLFRDGS